MKGASLHAALEDVKAQRVAEGRGGAPSLRPGMGVRQAEARCFTAR